MTQKFFKGDRVRIGDMPDYMAHFSGNCEAIVLYTHKEKFGGGKNAEKDYGLYLLPNHGTSAWYEEDQLTLIESDRFALLPKNHVDRKVWEAKKARDT